MSYRRYRGAPRPARWMDLKYAGVCSVCGERLPVGTRAWYSPADRSVTCTNLECARARGLTTEVWHGSPIHGRMVEQLDPNGYLFNARTADYVRDPGEDMADRWNEVNR